MAGHSWRGAARWLFPLALLFAAPAAAQDDVMTPMSTPAQPGAIPLGTGPLPGATAAESWHSQYGSPFARNVTEATLTPFLPDQTKATGTAVIVAPGGGFRTLSMGNEGWDVARALADRGVAAFVLKYRLNQTPAGLDAFAGSMREVLTTTRIGSLSPAQAAAGLAPQLADARAAFALVRARAGEWGVDPDRIGMIGFSAGAMLTMTTEFAGGGFGIVQSWRDADRPVEFHLYEQGGHGFGMYPKETTSTGWFEAWVSWLKMHGYLARKGA